LPKKLIITVIFLICSLPTLSYAKHLHPEKYYQQKWCSEQSGQTEFALPDKTRCDCLTGTHAIEFDFAEKWAEAIGQSLYYSSQTGKKAGIVLILEKEKDKKYLDRLNTTIRHYGLPVDVWVVR
jgi:hypothetical protein